MQVPEQVAAARRLPKHITGRERVGLEARSTLGAGEAGGADHQGRVVYQRAHVRDASAPPPIIAEMALILGSRPSAGLEAAWTAGGSGSSAIPASVDAGLRHIADRLAAHPKRTARRHFRPAARVPVRRAGQHDRDAHAHDEVRRVPVYSLYSETREPTRRNAARPRRARHRPAGRRRPHLHLHLHDGQLPEGRAQARA